MGVWMAAAEAGADGGGGRDGSRRRWFRKCHGQGRIGCGNPKTQSDTMLKIDKLYFQDAIIRV
jgi:hypothetical protein